MIGLYNIQSDIRTRLEKIFDICGLDQFEVDSKFPKLNGLFVDWKDKDINEYEFAHQAVIIENYVKEGIPVIIFDRYLKLTFKEYNWLQKFNTTFLEPVIKGRVGFEYFPFWTEPLEKNWFSYVDFDREKPREIELAYDGILADRIGSFEKYYSEYARLFPKKNVVFHTQPDSLKHKIDEWKNYNLVSIPDYLNFESVNCTVLIGSKKEYETGYLRPDLYSIMKAGCIPMMPHEHRFYGTVFKDVLVSDEREVDWVVGLHKVRGVVIEEIMETFLAQFPEIHIDTAIERIRSFIQ
jgi:hypothetical protein